MTAHYFEFSRHFDGNGRRKCKACRQTYDGGDHLPVDDLKPRTHYVCPSGGGYGHSSIYTGAYNVPELKSPRDRYCACGAEFVEEDTERWELSWEMQLPGSTEWKPTSVVRSGHAAKEQQTGLLELIGEGEQIRNVQLRQLASP